MIIWFKKNACKLYFYNNKKTNGCGKKCIIKFNMIKR